MKKILKVTATTFLLLISVTVFAQRAVSLRQFETIKQAYRHSPDPEAAGLDDGEDITSINDVTMNSTNLQERGKEHITTVNMKLRLSKK